MKKQAPTKISFPDWASRADDEHIWRSPADEELARELASRHGAGTFVATAFGHHAVKEDPRGSTVPQAPARSRVAATRGRRFPAFAVLSLLSFFVGVAATFVMERSNGSSSMPAANAAQTDRKASATEAPQAAEPSDERHACECRCQQQPEKP